MSKQSMMALAEANRIRIRRAEIKRRVRLGELTVAEALKDPDVLRTNDREKTGMRIGELLRAQNRWGRHRTRAFLQDRLEGTSENRLIGRLTERQRRILQRELGARA